MSKEKTELQRVSEILDVVITVHRCGGRQVVKDYENGYGVSIVCNHGSYGYESGLLELAVLHDSKVCYDTPITTDVIGWLDADEAAEIAAKVGALPSR